MDPTDIVGKKIDRLEVVKYLGKFRPSKLNKHKSFEHVYLCKCDCGNYIERKRTYLFSSWYSVHTKSCGCAQLDHIHRLADKTRGVPITHGKSKSRLYRLWYSINRRCYNKSNNRYNRYGGRGITVCDEWNREKSGVDGFLSFYNWAYNNGYYDQPKGTKRADILSIERNDPNGPYSPENCKWIPTREQTFNRTSSWRIELDGTLYSVSYICDLAGIRTHSLSTCWRKNGTYQVWKPAWIVMKILHPELGLHLDHYGTLRDKNNFMRLINIHDAKKELDDFIAKHGKTRI